MTVAVKHVEHRHLVTVFGFAVIIAVVRVVRRREDPQASPSAFHRQRAQMVERRLRHGDEVHARGDMIRGAVELVEQ
jgi:hypothetical protein